MRKHFGLKSVVVLVISAILFTALVSRSVWSNPGSSEIPISQYSFETEASHVVSRHGSTFYVRDGATGEQTSYSSDDTAIQTAINNTSSDGGSVYVKAGSYSASVTLRDNVTLTLAKGVSGVSVSIDSGADCTLIDEEQGYRKEYVAGSLYSLMDWRTGEFWYAGENRTDLITHPTSEASYIVETDGTYTWMTNCSTGQRDATGTDADEIVNWALGNLTSGRDWLETVYLKGDLTVNGSDPIITISSYTRLVGDAILTLANNAPTARIISATDVSHLEFRDFTIDGNRDNQGGVGHTGIQCQNGVDIQIVNVNITQLEQSGGGAKGRGIWFNWCNDTLVHECTLSYIMKTGIETHECYRTTITDNHLLHIDDANNGGFLSIQDYNNDHGYDTIISGNQFVNNTAGGHPFISVSNASRLLITGNTFNQSVSYDIRLGRPTTAPYSSSDHSIVSDNILANGYGIMLCGDFNQIIDNNFHLTHYGIVLYNCSDYTPEYNLVSGNHISDTTSYGILFGNGGGHNNTVSNNFIYNTGNSGIHMGTASDDNALLSNTFRDINPNECIYIGNANCNSTLIDGNDMRFNNDDVDDSGTGTIWGDNVDKDGNFDQGEEP